VRRDPPAHIVGVLGERPAQPARAAVWDRAARLVELPGRAWDRGRDQRPRAVGPSGRRRRFCRTGRVAQGEPGAGPARRELDE
jgi:hypothetical protein